MRAALFVVLLAACSSAAEPPAAKPTYEICEGPPSKAGGAIEKTTAPFRRYVDPFLGTGGAGWGVGSTFPGPQRPFGMVRPGPDTVGPNGEGAGFDHCSGYAYGETTVSGFSLTRMSGTGIVDYGTIGILPTDGMLASKTTQKGRRARFDKATEKASPGVYEVTLAGGIGVELTATDHVGLHRWTWPDGADPTVTIDVGHALPEVKILDGAITIDRERQEISGWSHFSGQYSWAFGGLPIYFVARFDRPFAKSGTWKAQTLSEEASQSGADSGAFVSFEPGAKITGAFAISYVDVDHARKNLEAEQATIDFDRTRAEAEAQWEALLSRVEIEASARDATIFYSALYHALLMPTLANDVDGTYRGLDRKIHVLPAGERHYTDLSLWDTYRTLHPWLSLFAPKVQAAMVRSIVRMTAELGANPKWPVGTGESGGMVGDGAAIVVADSWQRGIRDFDVEVAYAALKKHATTPDLPNGRAGLGDYLARGYIPIEGDQGAATTLEFAFADAALAGFAEGLGKTDDAALFRKHAAHWRNLWDAQTGFLLGRHQDGRHEREDDKTAWQKYWAEGSTWQYTWFVPHDLAGLSEAMGGRDRFFDRLDEFFALSSCQSRSRLIPKPYYWHTNEVVLFVPWAYAELGDRARTVARVHQALDEEYDTGPEGLPGNDDSGTLSAWYLFSSLGFFPRVGADDYLLAEPIFPKAILHLEGGDLVIERGDALTFDGAPVERPKHAQLARGGRLVFPAR
jgi:predicted alpha-1,2-mannosidase